MDGVSFCNPCAHMERREVETGKLLEVHRPAGMMYEVKTKT